MISRGYFIGAVVDEMAAVADKVAMRNQLGMTDLSIHAEEYFRNVLNLIYGWNLTSLNTSRSNEPGLDLGDPSAGVGVQVTSTASSDKVNQTLKAITDDQNKTYAKKLLLVVGRKQGSYTIDAVAAARVSFRETQIWDLTRLARDSMSLRIEQLDALHAFINKEAVRLRVELEPADKAGNFPTTNYTQ